MASPYQYTPLSPKTDQIRLLTLLPASDENEEIAITLQSISTKAAARNYEALSYVWGSSENPVTIRVVTSSTTVAVEDVSSSACVTAPLRVTQNLASALRHLRFRDSARTLWIDAVCIDQQNIPEKSEQVGKMGQIYKSAARVVIWLGLASPGTDLAMRILGFLGEFLHFDRRGQTFTSTSNDPDESHWADLDQPLPFDEAQIRALEELFWRPWFERLWVVQEVLLSADAVVVCGRQETTALSVKVAAALLAKKATMPSRCDGLSDGFLPRLSQILNVFEESRHRQLLELVRDTRGLKCVDDRDKVYAVLSLAKDGGEIEPDYSLSTIEVYGQLAILSMNRNQLRFLSSCELGSRMLNGPSWIPDWTTERRTKRIEFFNAATFACQPVHVSSAEGWIRVTAVRVGTVVDIDVVSIPSEDPSLIIPEIVRLLPADIESSTYKTGCSLMEAFSGTLICSGFRPQVPQSPLAPTLQKSMGILRSVLQGGDGFGYQGTSASDRAIYLDQVYSYTKNRALVRTEEGYIGLAPSGAKVGDTILAILSSESFTVVRPAPGNKGRYNVVGEAFLYGLNNGEAVLGPLPDHVRAEVHFDIGSGGFMYRDTRSGGVSPIDPRLEALGIPGEIVADRHAKLVSGDALEKAGIRLSQIELV
ncbi:hypothetical protein INS49_006114 [Diaporthe citri]|uniref:uncharacterized protein n=1 Tax=Diaporthe citri TaxID=83186 RepID=UPI001C7F3580|nr:uncharacterized protein INS49_006114 [Diaporthe citri]KAG6364513.1 hypothetical protein INS49_006114 [Diaporthe citri]